jgi:hypothetical protein
VQENKRISKFERQDCCGRAARVLPKFLRSVIGACASTFHRSTPARGTSQPRMLTIWRCLAPWAVKLLELGGPETSRFSAFGQAAVVFGAHGPEVGSQPTLTRHVQPSHFHVMGDQEALRHTLFVGIGSSISPKRIVKRRRTALG